jgi:hypothetical protein
MPAHTTTSIVATAIFAGVTEFLSKDERLAGSPHKKERTRASNN